MWKLYVTAGLILVNLIMLIALILNGVRVGVTYLRHKEVAKVLSTLSRNAVLLGISLVLIIIFVGVTQRMAHTPAIQEEQGNAIEGSIAELIKVSVNNHEEWISIRGKNQNNPILLFLAGGPGGSQLAFTRHELLELENHFTVVNWDQPGSGKSYSSMKRSDITIRTYIEDGIALTEYLRERFGQDKIYLVGESWGSALGIFLAKEKPEYYAGVIGAGQMVDFKETEIMDYNKALELAREAGDKDLVNKLIKQGEPLYYEGNIALKSATYLNYLSSYMAKNPDIVNGGYHTLRDMFSSEYGVLDSLNYLLGIMNTFNVVYPQLYEVDLREQYTKLEVPIYFFLGRHDINAPTELAVDYYERIEAPKKELVWFRHSGHTPIGNETELFIKETIRVFLQQ